MGLNNSPFEDFMDLGSPIITYIREIILGEFSIRIFRLAIFLDFFISPHKKEFLYLFLRKI